jgi:arylsulfatase A-like enzyme
MPEQSTAASLLSGFLAVLLAGCGGGGAGGPAGAGTADKRPNILLLTVDTLRPDHLGCYGYNRATSPNIDLLARRGVLFRQVISAAGRTVQSFPSILSGVYPMVHGLRAEGQSHEGLADRPTLTRFLRESGYAAFAVTQGLNVGLHRDFEEGSYDPDIYLDPNGQRVHVPTRNDREASRKASGWLRSHRTSAAPFFLWMRYDAPHWPYDAPEPYKERFDPGYRGAHSFNEERSPGAERGDIIFGKTRLPSREVEHAVAHYDGEVAYTDEAIGELLKTVQEIGRLDSTLILLTSDHGESLGEHDYFFEHGAYLYDETVRVPLIVSGPAFVHPGRVVEAQVRTIDILPTVLELAGVPPPQGIQGVSLVPRLRGLAPGAGPPAYAESGRNFYKENPRQYIEGVAGKWRMIRTDRYKLIRIPRDHDPIWELYDLRLDPGERANIVEQQPEVVVDLKRILMDLIGADPERKEREEPPVSPELEDNLRSLGYVGGQPAR